LTSRSRSVRSEVWVVVRGYTWFLWDEAAFIPSHVSTVRQSVYPCIEWRTNRNIFIVLRTWVFTEPCCIRDYLGYLTTGDVVSRPEGAIIIPGYYPSAGKTADVGVEGMVCRYI
jgi:hypothetical protein